MTGKELFEKYQGYKARYNSCDGIVCGYGVRPHTADHMCMYVTRGNGGWEKTAAINEPGIMHNEPGSRYYWIIESDIDLSSPPKPIIPIITSDIAEKYISDHFPTITDDEKDIYINIFMEGAKYIKDDTK